METTVLNVHYVIHIIGFHVTFNETSLAKVNPGRPPLTDAPSTSPPAVTVSENRDDLSVEHHVVATEDNERGHHLHRAQHIPHNHERLCDPLLDKFAEVMNHAMALSPLS